MNRKIFYIKLIHTLVWLFFVGVIGYTVYAGLMNIVDIYVYITIGVVIVEGIILMIFKGKCPITVIGYKYSTNHEPGFDIFLPKWLAKYNKAIFTPIFVMGLLMVVYRLIDN